MITGDLIVTRSEYSYLHDNQQFGIILSGSWKEGQYKILFDNGSIHTIQRGTIQRVSLYRK